MQQKSAGFTKEERRDFGQLLESGFVDTVRRSPLLPAAPFPLNRRGMPGS
jgi:exonuclease III